MTLPVPSEVPTGVVPRPNDQLQDVFRHIETRLSEAERKTLYSAIVSAGGLTVQDGGAIAVRLPTGVTTFYCGPLTFGDPPVAYSGIIMRRPDGTAIFYTFPVNGDVDDIAWRWVDSLGNEVLSSDAITGGLARPWIPLPVVTVASAAVPMSASASYTTLQSTGYLHLKQQPFVDCQALLRSDSGGIGNARFTIGGTPVGSVIPIPSGGFAWSAIQRIANPGDFWVTNVNVELQVQRTNGVGSVGGVLVASQCQT